MQTLRQGLYTADVDVNLNLKNDANARKERRMAIPKCEGYKFWTACGYEYDCEHEFADCCDNCICVTSQHNDYTGVDPRTGKVFNKD